MAELSTKQPILAVAEPRGPATMSDDMLARIKHAVDETDDRTESFLFIGRKSSGKKTLALTIPGRKFIFCFDPNASSGLAGLKDVDYIEFLPRKLRAVLKPTPDREDKARKDFHQVSDPPGPWNDFEKFHQRAQDSNFYPQYDVVGFISCTSMQDISLDHTVAMQGRPGYVAERNDRNLVGQNMANVFRTILSENVIVFATAHYSYEQDDETKRMMNAPVLIGMQKAKIPNIFSNVWMLEVEHDKKTGVVEYFAQTVEDSQSLNLGRSRRLAFLAPRFKITSKNPSDPRGWGIGQFFAQAGIKPKERSAT